MSVEAKTGGHQLLEVDHAILQFVDFIAGATTEMVVVTLSGGLVVGNISRDLYGNQPLLFHERLDRAVDRGDS